MRPDAMIFIFCMLSFKPKFSLSSFTFIKSNDMDHSKEKSAWIIFIDIYSHYETVLGNSLAVLN